MDFWAAKREIESLRVGESKVFYKTEAQEEIFVIRPIKQGSRLKNIYEEKKNFQIFLRKPNKREFRPNHLRLLIDLYLKKVSDPKNAKKIFDFIEEIFIGKDPELFSSQVRGLKFPMQIDNADANLYYAQLFMLEQAINWAGKSKFNPPHLFLMGYIRFVNSGEEEIDKIVRNAVQNPPPNKFIIKV